MIPDEGCDVYQEVKGVYEVELNDRGILSVKFNVYTFRIHAANGLDEQRSLTFNLETGKVYRLYDLFKRHSNYKSVLTRMIQEQIEDRDIPLVKEFDGIDDYEEFYLTENALVIYFQEIEFTPHYIGIPEFPIPYSQIKNLVREDGPIARFINRNL
ncbi:MAG: RsiV family protein [Desulfotomaculaceae bacterium]|nr:RsiV family protein [Desulfotomaculaceae bacterium]